MTALRTFFTTVTLLGLALAGEAGFAQAPTGSITNHILGATNALWDMSLFQVLQNPWLGVGMTAKVATNYWKTLQTQTNPPVPVPGSNYALRVTFDSPFVQNGSGRVSGKGTNTMGLDYLNGTRESNSLTGWVWTNVLSLTNIAGNYTVSGSIQGIMSGVSVLSYRSHASSVLPLPGKRRQLSATSGRYFILQVARPPQASSHMLSDSYGSLIALTGQRTLQAGGFNPPTPMSNYLDDGTYVGDGTWTLVLNFDPASVTAPPRLSGNATVTLNSGAVYPFSFTGRYSPKTGKSALLLKGVDKELGLGKGSTLTVTLASDQSVSLLGRVAGQVVRQK